MMNSSTKLNGTDKQIAWAEDIRAQMAQYMTYDEVKRAIMSVDGAREAMRAYVARTGRKVANADLDAHMQAAMQTSDAAWYIEHRGEPYALPRLAARLYVDSIR